VAKNGAKANEENVEAWTGYLAHPFQTQEVNILAGNFSDTYLECRLHR
jgi:hypothetical protein